MSEEIKNDQLEQANPAETILPGQMLSEARMAKSLSQAEVAKKLHLKLQVIQDIENNSYQTKSVPSLIYMRGYLRSYARLVGVPETTMLASFDTLNISDEPRPLNGLGSYIALPIFKQTSRPKNSMMPWLVAVVIVVLIGVALFNWKDYFKGKLIANSAAPAAVQAKSQTAVATTTQSSSAQKSGQPLAVANIANPSEC